MKTSSRAEYLKRIDRVVAHLSSRMQSEGPLPSIPELARHASLSEFHFMRVYRALAGESLGMTIQRLRLSRAVHLLTQSNAPVTEIASRVGYETPQAFAKALRRALDMTPSEVRERHRSRPQDVRIPTPRFTERAPAAVSIAVVEMQPFRVLALRNQGAYEELNLGYARLLSWLAEHGDMGMVQAIWGVPHHDRRDVPAGECIFDCCVASSGALSPIGEVKEIDLGGGRYVTYRHIGAYASLDASHDILLRDILPGHDLALREVPILHQFLNDPDITPEEQLETMIYIPVE